MKNIPVWFFLVWFCFSLVWGEQLDSSSSDVTSPRPPYNTKYFTSAWVPRLLFSNINKRRGGQQK